MKEGRHCFDSDSDLLNRGSSPLADPDGRPLIDPVIGLANSANPAGGVVIAVIGGNVLQGRSSIKPEREICIWYFVCQ